VKCWHIVKAGDSLVKETGVAGKNRQIRIRFFLL